MHIITPQRQLVAAARHNPRQAGAVLAAVAALSPVRSHLVCGKHVGLHVRVGAPLPVDVAVLHSARGLVLE